MVSMCEKAPNPPRGSFSCNNPFDYRLHCSKACGCKYSPDLHRETREGWPLRLKLSHVRTYGVQIKRGPSLVGSLGLSCRYKRFYAALAALFSPVQNIFSSLYKYIISVYISPSPRKHGHAVVKGGLSLRVYLRS
jgi:hypothetical protein